MKNILFTFALLLSAVVMSNAQTSSKAISATDSVYVETKQVEFYSSEEEFHKKNPSFHEDVKASENINEIAITNEAYLHFVKINKLYRKRLMA